MSSFSGTGNVGETMPNAPRDSDFSDVVESYGLYSRRNIEWYDKFERLPSLDTYNPVTVTREYVFYTKPDLHIFDGSALNPELAQVPIFVDAVQPHRYGDVLRQLQASAYSNTGKPKSPFINLLTNSSKSSIELPSIDSNTVSTAANINGTKLQYRLTSFTSDNDFSFSIEYGDTKYTEVYMLFKLFDEYERLKHQGRVTPAQKYIINKVLHDQISIYKFVVDADGETIIFFAKYYGCFPKNVPRDVFGSMSDSGGLSFTVEWQCMFVEDSDPLILADFNKLVAPYMSGKSKLPIFNLKTMLPERKWCSLPYIETAKRNTGPNSINQIIRPKLKWLE